MNELDEAVHLIIAQSLQDARRAYREAKQQLELAETTAEERREWLTKRLKDIIAKAEKQAQP